MEGLTREGFAASELAQWHWEVPIIIETSASLLSVKVLDQAEALSFFRYSLLISSSILRSRPVISSVYYE
jgi:hypothetical protein